MQNSHKIYLKTLGLSMLLAISSTPSFALKKRGDIVTPATTQLAPIIAQNKANYEVPEYIKQQNEQSFQQVLPMVEERPNEVRDLMTQMQIVLIIDRSGSQANLDVHPADKAQNLAISNRTGMLTTSGTPYWSQWDNTLLAAKYLSEAMFKYDKDGEIPVIFFDDRVSEVLVHNTYELMNSFNNNKPRGTTNLLAALEFGFKKYIDRQNTLFIVITDGQPDSGQEGHIENLIYTKMTKDDTAGDRFNVLFLRIGDDQGAKDFLEKMDNCTRIGNNVDTKEDDDLYKHGPDNLILNSITEHLDTTLYNQQAPLALPTPAPVPTYAHNPYPITNNYYTPSYHSTYQPTNQAPNQTNYPTHYQTQYPNIKY